MADPLRALVRSVPTRVGVNAEPGAGIGCLTPHGRDVDLASRERSVVRDAEHPGTGGVDARFTGLRCVVR